MAEVKFLLKDPKATTETLIFLKYGIKNDRLKYSTGEKVNPMYWDKERQRAITDIRKNTKLKDHNKEVNFQLERYKTKVKEVVNYWKVQKIAPSVRELRKELDKEFKIVTSTDEPEKLNEYIDRYIKEIQSGERTTEKGKRYAKGTIKNLLGFQVQFNYYQGIYNEKDLELIRSGKIGKRKKRILNYNDITMDFNKSFVKYCNDKNYSQNTIGRHIKHLKHIMRTAREEGLHTNTEPNRFKIFKVETDSIALTEHELKKLYDLKISDPKKELIRDVFLVGCYTALRYSDYSRINPDHIKYTSAGTKIIKIKTRKTGEEVVIPIRPELDEILKKYNYDLPKTYEQKLNKIIKELCRQAGISERIPIEEIRGGLTVKTTKPKCELVMSHTARRTGATNMYLAGIPSIDIKEITGHKTENNFLKYIKITKEKTADRTAQNPYFSNNKLKAV